MRTRSTGIGTRGVDARTPTTMPGCRSAAPAWCLRAGAAVEGAVGSALASAWAMIVDGFAMAGLAHCGMCSMLILKPKDREDWVISSRHQIGRDTLIVVLTDRSRGGTGSVQVLFERR